MTVNAQAANILSAHRRWLNNRGKKYIPINAVDIDVVSEAIDLAANVLRHSVSTETLCSLVKMSECLSSVVQDRKSILEGRKVLRYLTKDKKE